VREELNIVHQALSKLANAIKMSTRRPLKKCPKSIPKNEWLLIVASLDALMAKQASQESAKAQKPLFDKSLLVAVNTAYAATLRYYTTLLESGMRNSGVEKGISRLWQKAGAGIRRIDPDLASRLKGSNEFWVNDVTWERDTIQKAWAGLNSIRASANVLSPDLKAVLRWTSFSAS
jgi:hypothetical protein